MIKTKLAKAISMALAGSALAVGGISSAHATATTMYNLTTAGADDFSANTTPCAPCNGGVGTDGWVWGFGGAAQGSTNSVAKWAGTAGVNTTPFGYNGGAVLHWAVGMTASNDSAEISSQDAVNRYGVGADIDTAKGAWSDNAVSNAGGWRHDLEWGLFKSDVGGVITLNAQGVNQAGTNFGFTIFMGMDASNFAYNHHGNWNKTNNSGGVTANTLPNTLPPSPPVTVTTLTTADVVAYSVGGATPSNLNTISFNAIAGQVYTILLGGYRNGSWGDTNDGYVLNVSSSAAAVPIPAAVWLFGSALAGLGVIGRRKSPTPT